MRATREAVLTLTLIIFLTFSLGAQAAKIACVGNSITYGHGITNRDQQSYPAVLQSLLGGRHTVMNFGTSGCTLMKSGNMPYWKDRNFSASTEFKPDIVVLMLGTNDAKPMNWAHKDEFTTDYREMIDHYRKLGAKVYVAIPVPVYGDGAFNIDATVLNEQVVPLIRKIASEARAPVIDLFSALIGKPGLFPDEVHPTEEGAKLIAEAVAAILQKDELIKQ
ncbi:MAG TPA: GDSL-type esterase/lipase family protein [Bacteroidales bacterium]|nr:GDSL-type esterase/lipase family protein [Bacteroidales bacterium]